MNPPSVQVLLDRIRRLTREQRHADALTLLGSLPETERELREAMLLLAINQRCLRRAPDALATLNRLQALHADFSLLYQERGACYLAAKDVARAINEFRHATALNPALLTSWTVLEQLYRRTGDVKNSAVAAGHVVTLKRLPAQIVQAGGSFSDGDLATAERLARDYIQRAGSHVEALRLLARVALKRGAAFEAERILEEVLAINPHYRAARHDYAHALLMGQDHVAAKRELEILLTDDGDNRAYLALMAATHAGLGDYAKAIELYRSILTANPEAAEFQLCLGNSLKAIGRRSDAIEAYRAAETIAPGFGDAYWSLANLKVYRFTDEELLRMHAAEAAGSVTPVDRYHLCFALGKAYEDRGNYAQSWRHYEMGNSLKRSEVAYRSEAVEAQLQSQMARYTSDFLRERRAAGHPGSSPIFIVGMPRAGSTLLEQILATHSCVESAGECGAISRIARDVQMSTSSAMDTHCRDPATSVDREDFVRLATRYIDYTEPYRTVGRSRLIDKMPNNFWHIGLIHLLFPNATIIDVRRHPMDCCLSNLTQLFASGQEFSYGIDDVAHYYRTYVYLMQHWDRVLPGRVLRVSYEQLIANPEAGVRRVLQFCGLEYEPGCLQFYGSTRPVSTASSEQVRQPLTSAGIGRWRRYEAWLAGLLEALGDAHLR